MSAETKFDFDLAVVGAGSGGYAAARVASSAGLNTVVLEGGKEVGGLCILRGCMPTKALLHVTDVLHQIKQAKELGIQLPEASVKLPDVIARKNRLITEFADYRLGQLQSGKFKFLRAFGRFCDPHTLELSSGGTLTARQFILTTGSVISKTPLPQLEEIGCLTSDAALFLDRLPKSIIVLGGGAVAVEFAQFFLRMGSHVTIVQRSSQLLRDFDEDLAAVLRTVLIREGAALHTNTKLTGARIENGLKTVSFVEDGRPMAVQAEEVFHGLGREPATARLRLEHAGVRTVAGRIVTDEEMRTSAPHIFAAGDCTGPHEIVHLAIQQGETAAHNAVHPSRTRRMDYRLITNVVFTDPQIASVGLTEKHAKEHGISCLAASYPFGDHGKSIIMEARDGFVKLLAHPATGEILGGSVAGPMGGELIHEIIAAMHKRMTVHELAAMPHYHPTLAEIWTYPAEELAAQINPAA